jgi:hypothetical protein
MAIPFGQRGYFSQIEPLKKPHFLVVISYGPLSIMTFKMQMQLSKFDIQ